ncbi:Putative two-component response regulator, CheY-like (plasmid) [Azospirillum lipoferum 4B]|uniref:Two-component response regulator, CheY-like n=1 Tax=Azospirillum lipoferum (strain 4B) TaxID=862719 RepID=G7ZDT0_AZOL4|nr:Putative two-component response regulator, CheY-like [Azospirillum lipoferum 4B]
MVDDDEAIREALDDLLRSAGFRCRPFVSAEDFLAHADRADIACIILDVRMPGLSGLELQERLNADGGGHPPILFMTSYADETTRNRALGGGARDVLGKPVDGHVLIASLNSAMAAG